MVTRQYVLLGVVLLVLLVLGYGVYALSLRSPLKDTQVASVTTTSQMHFEIADTQAKQELGLGNRATIPDNYGMLFVFKDSGRYGFWMKDMLAPIDITWLSDNGTILLIDHTVDPATYPHVFYPPVPVKYVLETRAGYARDHGWEVGTKVALPAPYAN